MTISGPEAGDPLRGYAGMRALIDLAGSPHVVPGAFDCPVDE